MGMHDCPNSPNYLGATRILLVTSPADIICDLPVALAALEPYESLQSLADELATEESVYHYTYQIKETILALINALASTLKEDQLVTFTSSVLGP